MSQPTPTLRDLFEQALELRADERAAWLDAHCADRAQRDAIERLLATDAAADAHLLDRPFDDLLGRIPDTDTEAAPPSGTRIGPFTLHEKLGEGGSSIVYRAEREQSGVLQVVALKLLRRGLYAEHERRQFRDERRALAQLRHPGIAHLIEGGVTDAGIPYIALELIDGTPITEHVREHGLDLRQRLALFVAACRAVEAAHRALIVHRDLKPSNVLVTRDGAVKLLDFGIAKLLDAEPGSDATHTGHRAMTPGYAAPEQFAGGQITTATDVYALGVLLGELMTGHRRTHGDTRTPSSQVSADTAPGVLPAPAPKMRRQLRGDLDNIVLKATAEEPELRYASAAMLADDIERYLVDQPVIAHPPSAWYRTRKFVARHRGGVATTFAFLLAILAALGLALWQARVARTQTGVALAQAQRAEAVREFLIGVFENASPDESGGKPISARELLEKGERQVDSGLREQPVLQADVLTLLGQLYIEISDFKRANALLARALSASEQKGFPLDVRVRVLLGMASIEVETDAYDPALAHAREALAILARPDNANAEATANAHQLIIQSLIGKGDNADVEVQLRASLQQDQAALGNNNEYVADQWLQLGVRLGELGRYDESDAAFRASIDSYRAVFGENSNRVAHALNEFSNMLDDKGDMAGSEAALRRALAIRTETVGADHHDTLTVANNLLAVIEIEGRFAEALPQRIESLSKAAKAGTLHGRDLVAIHNAIGRDYRELGRLAESDEALHKALAITEQSQGPRSPWRIATLGHLARSDALRGHYAEAEARLREALSIMAETEPPTSPSIALSRAELGTVLRLQHRVDEALVELRPAAAAFGPAISPSNKLRPTALAAYCEALVDHGDAAQAKTVGEEAVAAARRAYVPHHSQIGTALFALARAQLALGHAAEAEALLREARDVRSPPYPADDLRVLEVDVSLVAALRVQGRLEEAARLRATIEPLLVASHSPYARDLQARLEAAVPAAVAK